MKQYQTVYRGKEAFRNVVMQWQSHAAHALIHLFADGTDPAEVAQLFDELKYTVLYEGVETDADSKLCREMSASYLQGFKYSKPVPIEQMKEFFVKVDQDRN